jgi:hypothetical protein
MTNLSRRSMVFGAAVTMPTLAKAAEVKAALGTPRSVITDPPRDFSPAAPPAHIRLTRTSCTLLLNSVGF